MKKIVPFVFIVLSIVTACKKSSDSSTDNEITGNYIKIDNDARQLGDVPSTDVYVNQSDAYLPEGTLLHISVSQKTNNIDGVKNDLLLLTLFLYEGGSSNTEYNIVNMLDPPPSSANVTVLLAGTGINLQMSGKGGKVYVTRDESNKITSLKFDEVEMNGAYEATVSSHIVIN